MRLKLFSALRYSKVEENNKHYISHAELYRPMVILLVLILAVLVSALTVIKAAYDYRRLFNDHQVLVHQWDELQVEWGQLLLEQSTWGGHGRIESEAEARLQMRVPEADETEIIRNEQRN
ncbi:cell division protein FtsL [Nitrincola sp. A-D6]|uniref:cell division protein FtsL n=1 Tax=Nitrincola sp. A-D6 TaxID=1545442 RepID=UPI000A8BBCE7|nr:cell division protein FtsL [Nitrincola sp. A-D6]